MSLRTDQLYDHLKGQAAKNIIESQNKDNKSAETKLYLALLGLLIFFGVEAIKVTFRKNFGSFGLNVTRVVLCALTFGVISAIAFSCINSDDDFAISSGSADTHFLTGMIYAFAALLMIVKGIAEHIKSKKNNWLDDYQGDSLVLSFMINKGVKPTIVQNLCEPLFALVIGIAACFFDRIAGIPVIFCAISYWLHLAFDSISEDGSPVARVNRMNASLRGETTYNEVNINE